MGEMNSRSFLNQWTCLFGSLKNPQSLYASVSGFGTYEAGNLRKRSRYENKTKFNNTELRVKIENNNKNENSKLNKIKIKIKWKI